MKYVSAAMLGGILVLLVILTTNVVGMREDAAACSTHWDGASRRNVTVCS